MDSKEFDGILQDRIQKATDVLGTKAGEYATEGDRLYNFKQAAHLQGTSMRQALGGMMAKHTVSVYDLINATDLASDEKWDEKLGDHINYLILLAAVVAEERKAHAGMNKAAAPLADWEKELVDGVVRVPKLGPGFSDEDLARANTFGEMFYFADGDGVPRTIGTDEGLRKITELGYDPIEHHDFKVGTSYYRKIRL